MWRTLQATPVLAIYIEVLCRLLHGLLALANAFLWDDYGLMNNLLLFMRYMNVYNMLSFDLVEAMVVDNHN